MLCVPNRVTKQALFFWARGCQEEALFQSIKESLFLRGDVMNFDRERSLFDQCNEQLYPIHEVVTFFVFSFLWPDGSLRFVLGLSILT